MQKYKLIIVLLIKNKKSVDVSHFKHLQPPHNLRFSRDQLHKKFILEIKKKIFAYLKHFLF